MTVARGNNLIGINILGRDFIVCRERGARISLLAFREKAILPRVEIDSAKRARFAGDSFAERVYRFRRLGAPGRLRSLGNRARDARRNGQRCTLSRALAADARATYYPVSRLRSARWISAVELKMRLRRAFIGGIYANGTRRSRKCRARKYILSSVLIINNIYKINYIL